MFGIACRHCPSGRSGRATTLDILVHKVILISNESGTIASGSLRRQAQWLNKYPTHKVVEARGNVNSREET
jgi:hydroxymethylbilane synthase